MPAKKTKNPKTIAALGSPVKINQYKLNDSPDLSDDQLALELGASGFDAAARYVPEWKRWVFWSGVKWQVDNSGQIETFVRMFLRAKASTYAAWAEKQLNANKISSQDAFRKAVKRICEKLRSERTIKAIVALARSNEKSIAPAKVFDSNPLLIGTPEGTIDLKTGEARAGNREDYITKTLAVAPAKKGNPPKQFLKFLGEIMESDPDMVAYIQRCFGYALTGLTNEHVLMFLYGSGRNGKSVLLNTLQGIMQDYARRAASSILLDSRNEGHSTGIAGLQGARLVAASELPAGKNWNESVIKDLTGGDVITARLLYQDYFDFKPQFTLMIAGNNQPSFRGVDEAIRARVHLWPFNMTIPPEKRDPKLEEKLRAEWPEILQWGIEGALEWQKQGLNPPAKVLDATQDYLDNEDIIGLFLDEMTIPDPEGKISNQGMMAAYRNWCESRGMKAWSQTALTKALKSRQIKTYKSGSERGFRGLSVAFEVAM